MHLINKRRAPNKRRVRVNAGLRGRVLNKRPRRLIEKIRYVWLWKSLLWNRQNHSIDFLDNSVLSCFLQTARKKHYNHGGDSSNTPSQTQESEKEFPPPPLKNETSRLCRRLHWFASRAWWELSCTTCAISFFLSAINVFVLFYSRDLEQV